MKLKEIPETERPRERLLIEGSSKISNQELLSILINSGTREKSAKELSLQILKEYTDVSNLRNISIEKLKKIKGIGNVKAITLVAAVELGRRIFLNYGTTTRIKMTSSKSIWENTKYLFNGKKQEYFYCLYFNNKQELIERKLLFMGTINRSVVHPREVFREAYLLSASNIVCIHNHPSGDVTPSMEDINFTRNIVEIGKIQGIPVVEHLIVSDNDFYSFYDDKNQFII